MAIRNPKRPEDIVLEFDEMGAISTPPMAEVYAGGLAEGLAPLKAWAEAGGAQTVKSFAVKDHLDQDPLFQTRVTTLQEVRKEQLKDPHFGEAIAMINLAYRDARARRHKEDVMEYVKLRLRAAEGSARLFEKTLPVAERPETGPKPANPVGKPTEKSPQSTRTVDDLRQQLVDKGLKNVPISEDEDA